MKKTLVDLAGSIKLQLTESSEGGKHLIARGEFGRADIPTQNRRVYPRKVWEREIRRINEAIQAGKVLGELDHPADGKTSLKRVSHIMTGLHMQDDGVIIGEAKILDNEYGRQLKSILEAGGAIGVSSRGMGSTAMGEDGSEVVQEDYQYMTHDFVADPAVLTSYPTFQTEVKWVKGPVLSEEEKKMDQQVKVVEDKAQEAKAREEVNAAPAEKTPPEVKEPEAKVEEKKEEELKPVEASPAVTPEANVKAESEEVKEVKVEEKDLRESIKTELMADPDFAAAQIALESIKSLVKPFMLPEDVAVVVADKEEHIKSLQTENTELKAKIEELGGVANRLGAQLHLERKIGEMKEGREEVSKKARKHKFESVKAVEEFLVEAKQELETRKQEMRAQELAQKRLEAKYESRMKAAEERAQKLEEALKNTVSYSKELGMKLYVSEKTRGNPNALKIREMCEGKTDRKEVDAIIERFAVATNKAEDYNAIKRRFEKLKNMPLVEEQLKEAGSNRSRGGNGEEGVLGEMKDLFPGTTLDQVEALM
jgi:hypothetical protein